jgi:hypothetical protein
MAGIIYPLRTHSGCHSGIMPLLGAPDCRTGRLEFYWPSST